MMSNDQLDLKILDQLSPEERAAALEILQQYATSGKSDLLDNWQHADWDEIPVDIDTFLDDDKYLGRGIWSTDQDTGEKRCTLFPYWRNMLHKLFPDNQTTAYNTLILTGCLAYDTEIPLLNGKIEKIGDLAKKENLDEYVYSYDTDTNQYVHGHLIKAFSTGIKPVYEIEFDNGTKIKATSNHKFMTRDKHWKSIDSGLAVGDSMMPAADKNLIKIKSVKFIGNEEVFDLTVEKYHNFAINKGIIAHNSIGLGKTLVAVLAQLYLLYRMLCLKDPYEYFGLMPSDKITFSMLNITLETAKGVGWDKLQQLVQGSEWFMNHGSVNASRTAPTWQPDKHIELIFGSNNNHVIGRALFSNFTDEANFSGGNNKNVDRQKEKLKKMIAQIDARMVSRFGKGTYKPTLNIIASSKDSEQSFLDSYIETKKKNESKTVLIIDEPQWVVRNDKGSPDDPGAFYVAVGGKFLPNELLPVGADEALVQSYRDKGYTTIIKVPPIYREDFETNLEQALMDDAGLASINSTKFLSGERLVAAKVDTYENPFLKDVIEVGDGPDDHLQYANFFDLSKVSAEDKARPLFIHLDMSTGGKGKGDKTGIAGVWITGKAPSVPGQDESLSLRYKLAFSVSIKAPRGFNISFIKNQNFIKWLKAQGFNIKGVSADTFQSASVLQELKAAGFNTSIISVDRVGSDKICAPYYYLKSAIYDRRVEIYRKCDLLTTELVNLERMSSGKIEHTEGGRYGSKDQSDGFCLDGNTEIFLLSGKHKTIRQLYEENNFKDEWVLGYNTETETFEPCQIQNVVNNGIKNNVIRLTLDTGQELICTGDHKILARDGNYIEAKDTLGVSLMPFTHKINVVKIESVAPREVYDIQLDKIHNFALTNGLIVHNCGALYNASLFASDYAYSYGESLASTFEINMIDSSDMRKKQIINGIQDEIAKLYSDSNYLGYKKDADPKRQEELRRYQEIADGIIII